ncbi:glycosyltransferase [Clostridium sp. C8-1-8]|uniref:glycosyltransferase n=1 Tax=Clostridium sp. C8-1-8 TaxID=2698831 RepID=UPI001369D17B|nr:glycosyltransferase [Clostridium sp. C8-1-8]
MTNNDSILIISDNFRKIDYEHIIDFYSHKLISINEMEETLLGDYSMILLDLKDTEDTINYANKIRNIVPSMPLLLISTLDEAKDFTYFRSIVGYGQIRSLNYRASDSDEILEYIQSLLHPEYPSEKTDIAIVLPVYNEASRFNNVYEFVKKLKVLLEEGFINASLYFINDGSKDNTEELVKKLIDNDLLETNYIKQRSTISSHELKVNTRKAGTYIEGIKSIRSEILVFVDADNSFEIEDIAKMINIIKAGYYDIIVATKDMTAEKRPPIRRFVSFFKRLMTKPMLPKGVYDSQTGLKAVNSVAAQYILPYLHAETELAIDLELVYLAKRMNFRVLQLPVRCIDMEGSHVDIVRDSIHFVKSIFKIYKNHRNISLRKI